MTVKINAALGLQGTTKNILPEHVGFIGRFGSPAIYRGHRVSSIATLGSYRTTVSMTENFVNPTIMGSIIRDNSATNRDVILCIDGLAEYSNPGTQFTTRQETMQSNEVIYSMFSFAIWN